MTIRNQIRRSSTAAWPHIGMICNAGPARANDLELIKAKQLCRLSDVVRDVRQRVPTLRLLPPKLVHPLMHVEHELIKMQALLLVGRHARARKEGVHDERPA